MQTRASKVSEGCAIAPRLLVRSGDDMSNSPANEVATKKLAFLRLLVVIFRARAGGFNTAHSRLLKSSEEDRPLGLGDIRRPALGAQLRISAPKREAGERLMSNIARLPEFITFVPMLASTARVRLS